MDMTELDVAAAKDSLARYSKDNDPRKIDPAVFLRLALAGARALKPSREASILATEVEKAVAWSGYLATAALVSRAKRSLEAPDRVLEVAETKVVHRETLVEAVAEAVREAGPGGQVVIDLPESPDDTAVVPVDPAELTEAVAQAERELGLEREREQEPRA